LIIRRRMMGILVTGGTGLVGSYVVRELITSHQQPVVLDIRDPGDLLKDCLDEMVFIKGGIEDSRFINKVFEDHHIEKIIHLGSLLQFGCERNPQKAVAINIVGTTNLLEAARNQEAKRFVFSSSGAVYGPQEGGINEASLISPSASLYGRGKFFCESLGSIYEQLYGITFVSLRYAGVFGPGKVGSPGIAKVIKEIESTISGKDVTIDERVSPDKKIHLVYVRDVARATILALEAEGLRHRVFNISGADDCYVTFGEFHSTLKKLVPSAGDVTFTAEGPNRGKVDNSLARQELGYVPEYSLEMGIEEDIRYYGGK
jgi:UDP-glucose 4-epimerase